MCKVANVNGPEHFEPWKSTVSFISSHRGVSCYVSVITGAVTTPCRVSTGCEAG